MRAEQPDSSIAPDTGILGNVLQEPMNTEQESTLVGEPDIQRGLNA